MWKSKELFFHFILVFCLNCIVVCAYVYIYIYIFVYILFVFTCFNKVIFQFFLNEGDEPKQ